MILSLKYSPFHYFIYRPAMMHSKQASPDSIKDYRRTLYWNPNLMLDKDGKATVTLYNNARTTQISVDAAGQAADGTLLWGEDPL